MLKRRFSLDILIIIPIILAIIGQNKYKISTDKTKLRIVFLDLE